MRGKLMLFKQRIGWLSSDFKDKNSKGKKRSWCKSWAKVAQRKIRKNNKIDKLKIDFDE